MKVIKQCKHEWLQITNSSNLSGSYVPSLMQCQKCKAMLGLPEIVQMETLEYQKGIQKWISIIALVISIVAIIVSVNKN